jgi:hypothetical protein
MFTNFRIKFWMKDAKTGKKVFMESDVVRVGPDDNHRLEAINTMSRRLNDKYAPRFRAQLFCVYEVHPPEWD